MVWWSREPILDEQKQRLPKNERGVCLPEGHKRHWKLAAGRDVVRYLYRSSGRPSATSTRSNPCVLVDLIDFVHGHMMGASDSVSQVASFDRISRARSICIGLCGEIGQCPSRAADWIACLHGCADIRFVVPFEGRLCDTAFLSQGPTSIALGSLDVFTRSARRQCAALLMPVPFGNISFFMQHSRHDRNLIVRPLLTDVRPINHAPNVNPCRSAV